MASFKTKCLLVFIVLYVVARVKGVGAEDTYTNKYDGVNLDEILTSERLLNGYIHCLLDEGPCTSDGKELKKNLPDAIGNDCSKCTARQRAGSDQVMHYIIDHRPKDWERLEKKYLSDGSYMKNYFASKQPDTKNNDSTNKIETDKEKK